jgi:Sap, sulfolipid-1-addressing protein
MWSIVLVMALVAASDPVRIGLVLPVISRPRPMRSLLAFWLGSMAIGIPTFLILLALLRGPGAMLTQQIIAAGGGSTARHIKIAIGLVVLSIAAFIAIRFSVRQRAQPPMADGGPTASVLQPGAPTAVGRLLARFRDVLKRGGLWVAFGAGLVSGPAWQDVVLALSVTAASGADLGTQVSVAITFLLVMLALVEIPLIGYLVTPAKSEAVMLRLLNWVRLHRHQILVVILAVAGGGLVATSMG